MTSQTKKLIEELEREAIDRKIRNQFEEWKKYYKTKSIPKSLTKKEKEKWIKDAWLYKENRKLMITGAGRILLWFCYVEGGWKKYLKKLIKQKRYEEYLECKKYRFREKLFGINILKRINKKNIHNLIEDE